MTHLKREEALSSKNDKIPNFGTVKSYGYLSVYFYINFNVTFAFK